MNSSPNLSIFLQKKAFGMKIVVGYIPIILNLSNVDKKE